MKKITLLALSLIAITNFAISQNADKLYRTEEGIVYTKHEMDSIENLEKPQAIAFIGDTVIQDTTYMKVKIYDNIEVFRQFTKKYQGQSLPNLQLELMDGEMIQTDDLIDKIVMINFWSTTCGPCINEIPGLNKLQEKYEGQVVFLAPLPENKAKAKKLLATHPFQFNIAPSSTEVFEQLGIDGYPKNFFVNREGIIQFVSEGTPYRKDADGKSHVSVYENYSKILDELLNSY